MSRRELYRSAKGAFAYLHICLGLFLLSIPWMILVKPTFIRILPIFFAVGAVVSLWSKRNVVRDLLEGRAETVCGYVVRRELGDCLRHLWVEYLFLDTETGPQRMIFFSSPFGAGIPGLLDSPLVLHYLPRSKIIVQVEVQGKPDTPRHRSKEWHGERPQREERMRKVIQPNLCRLCERYWLWEDLFLDVPVALFLLSLVWGGIKTVCNIAGL